MRSVQVAASPLVRLVEVFERHLWFSQESEDMCTGGADLSWSDTLSDITGAGAWGPESGSRHTGPALRAGRSHLAA